MRGKKELLADILFNSNVVSLFKRLPMRNKLIVLNYHRIQPDDPGFRTCFDDGVYNLNATEFERQIRWLKRNTLILSESRLLNHFKDGDRSFPDTSRPCVVITFDDGYKDNYTLAYPILKAHDVPAILFVASQMIDKRRLAWWDTIAYLIKKCTKPVIRYDGREFILETQRSQAIAHFQEIMKQTAFEQTKYLVSELSEHCEVDLPDAELQDQEILTWNEIREMANNQIAIGSHTHTHRVLSTIDAGAQKEEMILSKLIIEQNVGQPVFSISYPVGEQRFITRETAKIAAECGYFLGFTTNTGINDWKRIQPHAVKRIARLLEKVSTMSLLTMLPEIFTWDSAAAIQKNFMETHPTYADAYYRLGIIHLGQGKLDLAIHNFQKAVSFNPNYIEARIKLGISQAFAGNYDDAEKNLLMILEKKPSFADINYYLGLVLAAKKRIPSAIQYLEKAISINPAYKEAILRLGVLYFKQDQCDKAMDMLSHASQLNPLDPDLLSLVQAGQKIIASHGYSSTSLLPLFSTYIGETDRLESLAEQFITQINISPNLNDIMAIVEKDIFPDDNLQALLQLFLEYQAIFPEYADIHNMLGILHKKLGKPADAEICFMDAIRFNPKYVKARLNLFNLLREQERYRNALEHGYFLDRFNLPYPDFYSGLAECCIQLGDFTAAEQFAQKAVQQNPAYHRAQQALEQARRKICG
ncbi:MAG: tetratricopeptide repeat protein [Desulfatirhabdiaceae bacterium]